MTAGEPSAVGLDRGAAVAVETAALAAEVRALTTRELAQTMRLLLRARYVAMVALFLLAAIWHLTEPPGWQAPVMAACGLGAGLLGAIDRRRVDAATFSPRDHAWLLGSVLLLQTAIIVPTGGAASPAQLLYVPVATLAGVGLGRHRLTLLLLVVALALVWLFAALAALGLSPRPGPALLGLHPETAPAPPHVWIQAAVLTFALGMGSAMGMLHRAALDRAVQAAAVARREALAAIDARNRELMELSHTLAHELKNPLSSIQGLAGLMARKLPEGGREAEQAGVILGEARRMAGIVDELSSFARPAHGLAVRAIAPARLAADVVTLYEGVAAQRGLTLALDAAGPARLEADPRKIVQVLVNLVQNAVDATPAGGAVTLRLRDRLGGGAVFEVDDTGPGVSDDMRARLFVAGATTKAHGHGLGLRIARAIAEQHGGALRLENRPEGGCRATFELPAARGPTEST